MKYEWESKVSDDILARIDDILFEETGLTLAGIAVVNAQSVEGALIVSPTGMTSIAEADCRKDIYKDGESQYHDAMQKMRGEFDAIEGKA